MIKTLTKHGNSWAVIIDKPILDLLKIAPETPLEITTDGHSLKISPAMQEVSEEELTVALAETNRRYGKALKKLGE